MPPPTPSPKNGITAFLTMAAFISSVSMYDRFTLTRTDATTTLTYRHRPTPNSTAPPPDQGLILNPENPPTPMQRRTWTDSDWILDTGATSHVCSNRNLLHSYTGFQHSALMKSVAHFGPNPISVVGMGDVTLGLPASSTLSTSISDGRMFGVTPITAVLGGVSSREGRNEKEERARGRLTMHNVNYIPEAGINLISWSQLKRAKGLSLTLVGNKEQGLSVVRLKGEREVEEIMRFRERDGLYWLVRGEQD